MEIEFWDASNLKRLDISDVMLIYRISDELPGDRNYYITFDTEDECASLQYFLYKAGLKSGKGISSKIVWIGKETHNRNFVTVYSHFKEFEFSSELIPLNDSWGLYKFGDVFELKPEYKGYLTGKEYGI